MLSMQVAVRGRQRSAEDYVQRRPMFAAGARSKTLAQVTDRLSAAHDLDVVGKEAPTVVERTGVGQQWAAGVGLHQLTKLWRQVLGVTEQRVLGAVLLHLIEEAM